MRLTQPTISTINNANLTGADIRGAAMSQTRFYEANLTECNFRKARMYDVRFEGAIFCNTTMSDGSIRNGCF
ncbi:MAG: pentapeptide repeat-containing protein [Cyanobacteriota bacterium]|nr:pentapeptide repeat-containing protein [Cyanobacteriota bacterium]